MYPNPRDRRMPNRPSDGTRTNEDIRISPIRLVKEDGEAVIIETSKALQMAKDAGLDLVEVSPNAKPPVCRIINYGKYKFEQVKKAKAAKAKQHVVKLKEIKMHPKTAENDYQYRIKQAGEFLQDGMKVKLIMQFRGREMAHMDYGKRLMERPRKTWPRLAIWKWTRGWKATRCFLSTVLNVVRVRPKSPTRHRSPQPSQRQQVRLNFNLRGTNA